MPSIGNSDHDIVLLDTAITNICPRPPRRKIHLWKKANWDLIKEDIDSMWNDFKCTINNIVQTHVPSKQTTSKYTNPWMNTNIRRLIRRKQRAFSKAKSTHTKRDRDRYKRLQQEVPELPQSIRSR